MRTKAFGGRWSGFPKPSENVPKFSNSIDALTHAAVQWRVLKSRKWGSGQRDGGREGRP